MKKISVIFVVIFVLAFTLGMTVKNVAASPLSDQTEWNMGTEVKIDLTAHPAPQEWLQLFGDGVKIDTAGTICHPFREGQFGWTPVIYQLTAFGWYELPTTNEKASSEGEHQACAYTAYPGTFALFGYYVPPADVAKECTFDTSSWYMDYWDVTSDEDLYPGLEGWYLYSGVAPFPAGTRVTYELLEGFEGLSVDASGSTITYDYHDSGSIYADFMTNSVEWTTGGNAIFELSAGGCSAIVEVYFNPDDAVEEDDPCADDPDPCCEGC
jgi:hypothetical protein